MCIVDLISSSWILCGRGSVGAKTRAGWNANTLNTLKCLRGETFLGSGHSFELRTQLLLSSWNIWVGSWCSCNQPSSNMNKTDWWRFETGNLKLKINIGFSKDTQLLSRMQTNSFPMNELVLKMGPTRHATGVQRCDSCTTHDSFSTFYPQSIPRLCDYIIPFIYLPIYISANILHAYYIHASITYLYILIYCSTNSMVLHYIEL